MIFFKKRSKNIPLDVPKEARKKYQQNSQSFTFGKERVLMLAGDQKIEHLNDDFWGEGISPEDASPEHLFKIAQQAKLSALACQWGLISQYGHQYQDVNYVVKINSKTNLQPDNQDPKSESLINIEQIVDLQKNSRLKIIGIGYTIYLGSEYENIMLKQASETILKSHQNGLLAILWVYPRGKKVIDPQNPHLIAGACGVASSLGADFIKITYQETKEEKIKSFFEEAKPAAGKTKIICAGGPAKNTAEFLQLSSWQIKYGASGLAIGRNLHQKGLNEAVGLCQKLKRIMLDV